MVRPMNPQALYLQLPETVMFAGSLYFPERALEQEPPTMMVMVVHGRPLLALFRALGKSSVSQRRSDPPWSVAATSLRSQPYTDHTSWCIQGVSARSHACDISVTSCARSLQFREPPGVKAPQTPSGAIPNTI